MADNGEVNDKETVKKRSANESKKALVKKEKKPKKKREKPDPAKAARQKEKRVITKNVIVISFGFLFLFTAFQSLQNLQSSLNPDEGLGLASLCVIYASLILSCMFVPPFLIGRLGCKWTLVLAMTGYVLYTVANYHASWYTLMPASILLGERLTVSLLRLNDQFQIFPAFSPEILYHTVCTPMMFGGTGEDKHKCRGSTAVYLAAQTATVVVVRHFCLVFLLVLSLQTIRKGPC